MKKRIVGAFSLLGIVIGGLTFAVQSSNKVESVEALYTPSTHYEVSDTASELTSYYSSVGSDDTGDTLLAELRSINSSKYHKNFSYSNFGTSSSTSPYVYTDYPIGTTTKDSNGQIRGSSIASFYTKTTADSFNKEHVWPNSKGGNKVENDILMPRPTISSENSSRGNSNFVEGMNSSSGGWDPYTAGYDIECRGECARIMLYCVVASSQLSLVASNSGSSTSCGNMNTLIKWHFDYAPSDYEMNRNNGAEYLQGNRNPFVDHPEYVAKIWSNFNSTVSSLCTSNESKYSSWTPGSYCAYGTNTPVNNNGVSISASTASVTVGSTTTLSATSTNSGTITWTTSNSSVASLSSSSSSSGANITITGVSAGTATITAKCTINGTQYSQTCTVTVTKVVSSLSKGSTSPTKTTYTAGESFDPTGLTITATYSDSTSSNVTSSVVWTPDPLTAGTTSVTGTFGGKSITITGLTVNAATEPEIIDSNSDLSVGDYVVLRTAAGVGVTGWNNNKDATVSETESEWKKFYVASASSSSFTLKDESANNFIASPGSSNQFVYGSAATCSTDSEGHLICNNRYLCKNGTNYRFYSSISSYLPFFIYKVPASSSTKTLSSISVSTAPTKTTYIAGEYFDPTGLVITKSYSDSTSDTYTYANHTSEFTFSPTTSTALTTSNTSVTITYGGKSCSQAITVNAAAKTLSSISINGYTTAFTVDDTFSFGGTVTAHFSDSSTSNVTASATFSGYNMSVAGNYTVTVSYTYGGTTKTATYQITVSASGGSGGDTEEGSQRISASTTSTYYETGDICPTGSTSSATATCDAFDVSWLKNGSSNSIAYTYAEIRIYASHSFTITPKTDYTITSVVITANSNSYASAVGGSSLTNCTKDVDNAAVTLTPTDGTAAVGFTNTAQSRINYIIVNYETESSGSVDPDPITSITASVSKTYYVGETISSSDITVKDNNNDDVTSFTFANDGYQFTYADATSGGALTNKTFTNAISGANLTCSLTVQVQRKARTSELTQNLSVLYTDLPTSYQTSTTERTAASGVKFIAYNLANYSSKMQFKASGGYFQTTQSMQLKTLTINNRETNVLTVYGSTNGTSFSQSITGTNDVYDLSGYTYIKVMKNGSGAAYCSSLTITVEGDSAENLANYVMYEDTANQCTSKFNTAKGYFEDLSTSERSTFMTSDDYVITNASRISILNMNESNNTTLVVIMIVSLSFVGVAGFYILKKRKEQ